MSIPNDEPRVQTLEQLCEAASHETDTEKLLTLTREIDRKLEERERRAKSSAA
jgi:hypothetical protein